MSGSDRASPRSEKTGDRRQKGHRARAARVLEGIGAAPGVAIARALVLEGGPQHQIFRTVVPDTDVAREEERLDEALALTRQQLLGIKEKLERRAGDEYAFIFDAHLLFLEDKHLVGDAIDLIRAEKVNAEWALAESAKRVERFFAEIDDPYLRERGHDVADVHDRIQRNLAGIDHHELSELEEDVILVARSLPPSMAASLHHERVAGFVTEMGGRTSHTAIVAKSLEIPAVVGVKDALREIPPNSLIAVDGRQGQVVVSPNEAALRRYVRRRSVYQSRERKLIENRALPAITSDGVRIHLRANVELLDEMPSVLDHGAEGIGLYRSEFLFLKLSPNLPSEEDHYATYRDLIEASAPHPVTIRTLDLGGEKYFHDVLGPGEPNPILGLRAIRFCLSRPEIIEAQLRGILRAAVHGPTRLMFPLISVLEEVSQIRELLAKVRADLEREGVEFDPDVPVGIMIEVPSAAALADLLAKDVDFFAIGTNDLIQYTLAVDRGNEHVSHLYQPLNPAVLRLIDHTAKAAQENGIGLSLCGEMGANPLLTPLLIGFGIQDLSMDPVSIPLVKELVRSIGTAECRSIAEATRSMRTAAEVEALLSERVGPILTARGIRGRRRKLRAKTKEEGA